MTEPTAQTSYQHTVSIEFIVISTSSTGEDFTPSMIAAALLKRILDLGDSEEWLEAVGAPSETSYILEP
jgi:hypothetical protein